MHTCRRWRNIILESSSSLQLHLYFTHGKPIGEMLQHSPPLPLFIDYGKAQMSTKDEEGVLLVLQHHHDRVRLINLREPDLQKLVVDMGKSFPMLENLRLISLDPFYNSRLPETFTAQRLSHLTLIQVGDVSAPGLPLLASITGLVTLSLRGISSPTSLPVNYLVSRLSLMPLLERLTLEFASESFEIQPSSPGNVRSDIAALQTQMVQLSKLSEIVFRGRGRYLEGLVSCIRAPVLTYFTLSFFPRPSIPLPRLSEFLIAAEELRYPVCSFTFSGPTEKNPGVSIVVAPGLDELSPEDAPFRIRFPCRTIDAQVACAGRISTALAPMLSSVERLHLEYYATRWHRGFPPEIPREAWFELLRPFSNVKKLQLDTAMSREVSFALCPEDGPPAEGVLPKLSKLLRPHRAHFEGMLNPFIAARQAAGQRISKRRCAPTSDSSSESEEEDDPMSWLASQLASDEEEGSTELDTDSDFE